MESAQIFRRQFGSVSTIEASVGQQCVLFWCLDVLALSVTSLVLWDSTMTRGSEGVFGFWFQRDKNP